MEKREVGGRRKKVRSVCVGGHYRTGNVRQQSKTAEQRRKGRKTVGGDTQALQKTVWKSDDREETKERWGRDSVSFPDSQSTSPTRIPSTDRRK